MCLFQIYHSPPLISILNPGSPEHPHQWAFDTVGTKEGRELRQDLKAQVGLKFNTGRIGRNQ